MREQRRLRRPDATTVERHAMARGSATRYIGAMTYVALLRGVNVGGRSTLNMRELKRVFEATGLTAVTTYINSGNVVFATDLPEASSTAETLERAIVTHFGIPVRVLVRSRDEIRSIVEALPAEWVNDKTTKCDVFFLWDDADEPTVLQQIEYDPAVDDVRYTPGAIIRRVDRSKASRSKLTRVVGTPLYQQMTVRNCNTTRKLLELMSD
jgi:uncharacterized protein (DUF1697 family)